MPWSANKRPLGQCSQSAVILTVDGVTHHLTFHKYCNICGDAAFSHRSYLQIVVPSVAFCRANALFFYIPVYPSTASSVHFPLTDLLTYVGILSASFLRSISVLSRAVANVILAAAEMRAVH